VRPEEFTEKVLAFLGTMDVKATKPKFYVEINFDAKGAPAMVYSSATDTVIRIQIFPTQWELLASKPRPKKESCARYYADADPFISDDALGLFAKTRRIDEIPALFHEAEKKLGVAFPRVAYVRTNLAGGKKAIAAWVKTL
jgi:hypothetical protein